MAAITTMWWATNLFSTHKTGVRDALCCVCMTKGGLDEFRNINTKQLYYQFASRTGLWSGSVIFQCLYWITILKVLDDLVEASVVKRLKCCFLSYCFATSSSLTSLTSLRLGWVTKGSALKQVDEIKITDYSLWFIFKHYNTSSN